MRDVKDKMKWDYKKYYLISYRDVNREWHFIMQNFQLSHPLINQFSYRETMSEVKCMLELITFHYWITHLINTS